MNTKFFYLLLLVFLFFGFYGQLYAERIWLHPQFHRTAMNGEQENFNFMASHDLKFDGMRYELPWSLFEDKSGKYNFEELDKLMANASGGNAHRKIFKVYLVLHDKTWFDGNPVNNNWPVPTDMIEGNIFVKTITKNGRTTKIRVARRWKKEIKNQYLKAITEILWRAKNNDDYKQLEVISLGESSLAYDDLKALQHQGYSGAEDYKKYLKHIHQQAISRANYISNQAPRSHKVKIAMNLNWIPGQPSPKPNQKWFQHEVLKAVKTSPTGVQAIEDVHGDKNNSGKRYKERVYAYTLGQNRVLPKNKVWAHISCDTKHNGQLASANLAKARALANNIVLRHKCDGTSTFYQYVKEILK